MRPHIPPAKVLPMPAKPKSKRPPRHKFVRVVRMATALKILARETVEHRTALDEAAALKARYESAKP